jgi:hypothetical protein
VSANGVASSGFSAAKGGSSEFFNNLPTIVFAYGCHQGFRV